MSPGGNLNRRLMAKLQTANYKESQITISEDGKVTVTKSNQDCSNVKETLREISKLSHFAFQDTWTTRQFGQKLVAYLNAFETEPGTKQERSTQSLKYFPKKNIKQGDAIVLNRMYVGDYLSSNLGHEIINMYAADNGNHYLYLNATGNYKQERTGQISSMLLTKSYKQNVIEVIGMATGLEDVPGANKPLHRNYKQKESSIYEEQKKYIEEEGGISYGGISILDIFNDAEQQSIFITYKAKNFYRPKIPVFIVFSEHKVEPPKDANEPPKDANELPKDAKIVRLNELNRAKTSLKQYIYRDNAQGDHKNVIELINKSDLWEKTTTKVEWSETSKIIAQRKISLFDICQIQNDENKFSNALAYFMSQKEYWNLWKSFWKSQFGIELADKFSISREVSSKLEDPTFAKKYSSSGGRIDLLICDEKNIIVIENKIKSDINSIDDDGVDGDQLLRYYNYIQWLIEDKRSADFGKKPHFIILTPKYNIPTIKHDGMRAKYKIITYTDLYVFLSDHKKEFEQDSNFMAFYEAMHRHTHDNINDYLYYEMQERFFRRIKMFSNNQI